MIYYLLQFLCQIQSCKLSPLGNCCGPSRDLNSQINALSNLYISCCTIQGKRNSSPYRVHVILTLHSVSTISYSRLNIQTIDDITDMNTFDTVFANILYGLLHLHPFRDHFCHAWLMWTQWYGWFTLILDLSVLV